jgi:thiol-disulfide isomerase/thioredoxin
MKSLLFVIFAFVALGQEPKPATPPAQPDPEQQELNAALADAGASGVDFIRALENHLKKYPKSSQRVAIERAIVKAAIEAKDEKRIIEYGEKTLATDPVDPQVLDRLIRTLLLSDEPGNATRALVWDFKYIKEIDTAAKQMPQGRMSEAQWNQEMNKAYARAYVYQARALGNLGKQQEAVDLAHKSWEAFPTAGAAREIGRWLARMGKNMEAVEWIANAFTIEDPGSTEIDRGKDRMKMGELYQKATGSEKGLGDLILVAYDRTSAIMGERIAKLKAADPNVQASKITDFTLAGVEGAKLALSSLRGKTVVLDFWATWCGPCRAQHPLYDKVQERFKDNSKVIFLAIATDEDRELVAPFLKQNNWNASNVYYEAGITKLLDISSIPTTLILDKTGNIASRMNGFAPERFVDLLTQRINDTLTN